MRSEMVRPGSGLAIALALAACGQVSGKNSPGDAPTAPAADASLPGDAAPDAPVVVPAQILITGIAQDVIGANTTPCFNPCELDVIASNNTNEIAKANTASNGTYVLTLPTSGMPVNALRIEVQTDSSLGVFNANVLFTHVPLVADQRADVKLFDNTAIEGMEQAAGITPSTPSGLSIIRVLSAAGSPLAGATVNVVPVGASIVYTDGNGNPVPLTTRASTAADGTAYLFNSPASPTVSATAAGLTFTPRKLIGGTGRTTNYADLVPDP